MPKIIYWFVADPIGLFRSDVHGEPPSDAVQITEEECDALIAGQASGLAIAADPATGKPVSQKASVQIPTAVNMRQARLALLAKGVLPQIDAALAALPSPQKEQAQIEWEFAATVQRDSPLVQMLAAGLKLSGDDLDALFTQAATL